MRQTLYRGCLLVTAALSLGGANRGLAQFGGSPVSGLPEENVPIPTGNPGGHGFFVNLQFNLLTMTKGLGQQNIALRNGVLVQAQRGVQQTTIDLSLFLRDGSGRPTLAGADRLPAFPEVHPIDVMTFDAYLRTAFDLRPEPRRLRLQREKAAVELRLATNQTLPTVNAVVAASQDVGSGTSPLSGPNGLDRTTVSAGLAFQLPVQRRDARGRVMQAQAQLAQLDQQLRHAEDVVRAEVQDTFSALERAFEFHQQAKKRVELARLVTRAEQELQRRGRSDVLRVTLREQASFDAEIVEIAAQQDYFRAVADFRAAVGAGGR